ACMKILELDSKKDFDAKVAVIDFWTKKILIANVRPEFLTEIQKFPFPIQRLIAEEAYAVSKKVQEGKKMPNLKTAECFCKFFTQYMLPCRHIFHKQLCGDSNILMLEMWYYFQGTFKESGIEVYQSRQLVEILLIQRSDAEKT
ncbi:25030_t:CDS:1, partial [Racocetra persica]